jgi:hypothetical protein
MTKLHIMNIKLYNIHDTKFCQYWENETQIQTKIVVCPFSSGHCVVCPSIYGFWLPLWYIETLLLPEHKVANSLIHLMVAYTYVIIKGYNHIKINNENINLANILSEKLEQYV